ncbi:enoyl-CoA hydratase [Paracoccus aestuarii]|uniref:Enoyl-CoA hydratase n=1 Tax=Paracoccus aestuarii TaxID=453842 RepID=A0A418ZV32_9RHOB|nr:enoyl-CoA hydratase family protein [Paracoccus aestuarii]RJL02898.1 enoyl-CoA hydratase [Paracoccus aestuarii]WCQ98949.1 enoyl-CoA hydratase/isomerase family protein [Paracoccus aestuarii]
MTPYTNPHCEISDLGDRLVVENRNAARRNALTPEFYDGLHHALRQAAEDPRIGAVLIMGEGDFFCAGGDLTVLATAQGMTEDARRARIDALNDLIRAVVACPRPVIAVVEGGAAGAGLSLALACDMVIAARDARFTAAYVNAGLVPDGGLTAALTACLPPQMALQMALTGQPVPAERLHALGVIAQLTEPGEAIMAAMAMADRLAQGPADAQAAIKRLMTGARATLLESQLTAERDAMAAALAAPEAAEGIGAFLAKRPPDFRRLREGQ